MTTKKIREYDVIREDKEGIHILGRNGRYRFHHIYDLESRSLEERQSFKAFNAQENLKKLIGGGIIGGLGATAALFSSGHAVNEIGELISEGFHSTYCENLLESSYHAPFIGFVFGGLTGILESALPSFQERETKTKNYEGRVRLYRKRNEIELKNGENQNECHG